MTSKAKTNPVLEQLAVPTSILTPRNGGMEYQALWKYKKHSLRVVLDVDGSYDFQSSLRVELLTTIGWKVLITLPAAIARTQKYWHNRPGMPDASILSDEEWLLERAIAVLDVEPLMEVE